MYFMRMLQNKLPWRGYVLAAACGLYMHYYAALALVAQNLFALGHLLSERRLRALPAWILAQLATLALFAPWLYYARDIFSATAATMTRSSRFGRRSVMWRGTLLSSGRRRLV